MKMTQRALLLVFLAVLVALSACRSNPTPAPNPNKPVTTASPTAAKPVPPPTPQIKTVPSPAPVETTTPQPAPKPALSSVPPPKIMQWPNPPAMTIDQTKMYNATIKTTSGDFVAQLFPKESPLAVNNFVFLARQGFYDGVKFHRIVKGFVIQGGDQTGTGSGGPGYRFADEKVTRDYVSGTLAMANSGPNTNGSQFFVCLANLPSLPKNYTIIGIVTSGLNVVTSIGNTPVTGAPGGEMSLPVMDVRIVNVTIEEK